MCAYKIGLLYQHENTRAQMCTYKIGLLYPRNKDSLYNSRTLSHNRCNRLVMFNWNKTIFQYISKILLYSTCTFRWLTNIREVKTSSQENNLMSSVTRKLLLNEVLLHINGQSNTPNENCFVNHKTSNFDVRNVD